MQENATRKKISVSSVPMSQLFKSCLSLRTPVNCSCVVGNTSALALPLRHPLRHFNGNWRGKTDARNRRSRLVPEHNGTRVENGMFYGKLAKPLCFTVGFGCCSFVGAAIWQYEHMRRHAINLWRRQASWIQDYRNQLQDHPSLKQQFMQWWNTLSEGQRIALAIIGVNSLVFLTWHIPGATPFMLRYFASNPAAKALCWPMVLSTFSHYSFWHFAVNMYVLYSFSTGVVAVLGREQFLAMYLTAGVVSSFSSYMFKVVTMKPGFSLGASGCLMGLLGFFCTQFPNAKLAIVFLPMFSFTADVALKGIIAVDTLGIIFGWKMFDHAAHLGGVLFGICYANWGREYIWAKREPLVRWWNDVRGKPK